MCTALEELKREGIREGEVKGIIKHIENLVRLKRQR